MRTLGRRLVASGALVLLVGACAWAIARGATQPSASLRGSVIVVDPGHGGVDGGAPTGDGRGYEKDLTLELALRLRSALDHAGATVILTRDADFDPSGLGWSDPERRRRGLQARVDAGVHAGAAAFISLHMDSSHHAVDPRRGPNAFYGPRDAQDGRGRLLATAVQRRFTGILGVSGRVSPLDVFVLRANPVPAALIECAFLNNPEDLARIRDPAYQETLARAITAGIGDFLVATAPAAVGPAGVAHGLRLVTPW